MEVGPTFSYPRVHLDTARTRTEEKKKCLEAGISSTSRGGGGPCKHDSLLRQNKMDIHRPLLTDTTSTLFFYLSSYRTPQFVIMVPRSSISDVKHQFSAHLYPNRTVSAWPSWSRILCLGAATLCVQLQLGGASMLYYSRLRTSLHELLW